MPGIAGIISLALPVEEGTRLVSAMAEAMAHEASYRMSICTASDFGVYAAWVGHGRPGRLVPRHESPRDVDLLWCGESSECDMDHREPIESIYARTGDRFV